VPFPMLEDPSMAIARAYGMLPPGAISSAREVSLPTLSQTGRKWRSSHMTTEEVEKVVRALIGGGKSGSSRWEAIDAGGISASACSCF
jgi:alkyl hydroperoxide reductase subunit AhpC